MFGRKAACCVLIIIFLTSCSQIVQVNEGVGARQQERINLSEANVSEVGEGENVQPIWSDTVTTEISGDYLIVKSNGIPNHETGDFPMMADTNNDNRPDNPNSIEAQEYTFKIPLYPKKAATTTELPMGPIGIALSGAVFFNPYALGHADAVLTEVFDSCQGHPEMEGRYHYHQLSDCFDIGTEGHSSLIGYAFDGFGIYGPYEDTETTPTDLDACNGHEDSIHSYHYHTTEDFPYLFGCYAGVVEAENFDQH